MSARGASLTFVLLLVLAATGCEEDSSGLVTDIGTVGFVLTDPALSPQVVTVGDPPPQTIQSVEWQLTPPAELSRQDGSKVDLLFGATCDFIQTIDSSFNPLGPCSGGILLGSTDDFGAVDPPGDLPVMLNLIVNPMFVRRAKPLTLPNTADYDADGVDNETDNCPLQPNPDQADSNEDGIGNTCSFTDFFGQVVPDNDGDGVADANDNCVWFSNPLQEDTTGIAEQYGIPDGIGDACEEQIAQVTGIPPSFPFSFTLALATGGLSFVTVDFDSSVTLPDDCFTSGTCALDAGAVKACGDRFTITEALLGCKDPVVEP